MNLTTILLIAIPIGLMVVMHGVGHGGRLRGGVSHDRGHEPLGGAEPADSAAVDPQKAEGRQPGHHHGRRGGCR